MSDRRGIVVREPFVERLVRFLELWEAGGWSIKLYGLGYRDLPTPETVAAAKDAVLRQLPRPATTAFRYGLAFAIVHEGQDARWLLVDWWEHESILCHRLLTSTFAEPAIFNPATGRAVACVWELAILEFERRAWVDSILRDPSHADVSAYLTSVLATTPR